MELRMMLDKLLLSFGSVFVVAFIYWFFFGKKDDAVNVGEKADILVDGGYNPSTIKVKRNKKTIISLLRKDENFCLEEFILPDLKIKKYLPLNQKVEVEITPTKTGTFRFHCGMNMFHGKVIVE